MLPKYKWPQNPGQWMLWSTFLTGTYLQILVCSAHWCLLVTAQYLYNLSMSTEHLHVYHRMSLYHSIHSCVYTSSAPSAPRMLTVTGTTTGSTVELNWLPPLHPNGAIHYEIEYDPAMPPGDPVNAGNSSSLYFTLTLPNDHSSYTVRVRAVNSRGSATSGDLVVHPGRSRIGVYYTRNYSYICLLYRKCYDIIVTVTVCKYQLFIYIFETHIYNTCIYLQSILCIKIQYNYINRKFFQCI